MSATMAEALRRAFVVLNPVSGTADQDDVCKAVRDALDGGWQYEVYETTGKEDLAEIVRDALKNHPQLVVAVGGDGTVSGAANGLMGSEIPLAIIPSGTGNMLARTLDIPLDPRKALALLGADHEVMTLDAMKVGKRYFVMNVSVGVSSSTMANTTREAKRRSGMWAYAKTMLAQSIHPRTPRLEVTADAVRVRSRASEVLVINGGILGESYNPAAANVHMDDGVVDMFIVRARRLTDFIPILWDVLWRRERRNPRVRYLRAGKQVTIQSGEVLPVQADGEVVGHTPVIMEVVPSALRVVVPHRDKENGGGIVDKLLGKSA